MTCDKCHRSVSCNGTTLDVRGGLCEACRKEIRENDRRAAAGKPPVKRNLDAGRYATMQEIDAMVAEQMRCLPEWWNDDGERRGIAHVDI